MTRALPGSEASPPAWGDWLRIVSAQVKPGIQPILQGPSALPLLALSREEKGRVALLLSDHAWLWARGYQEGGPYLDLLRRLGHWLMKEPALEEEALRAQTTGRGREVRVERQTMAETAEPVTRDRPDRHASDPDPGAGRARPVRGAPSRRPNSACTPCAPGALVAFVSVGPPNPRELADVFSDTERLKALAEGTGGSIRRRRRGRRRHRRAAPAIRAQRPPRPAPTGSASARATAPTSAASRSIPWRSGLWALAALGGGRPGDVAGGRAARPGGLSSFSPAAARRTARSRPPPGRVLPVRKVPDALQGREVEIRERLAEAVGPGKGEQRIADRPSARRSAP